MKNCRACLDVHCCWEDATVASLSTPLRKVALAYNARERKTVPSRKREFAPQAGAAAPKAEAEATWRFTVCSACSRTRARSRGSNP